MIITKTLSQIIGENLSGEYVEHPCPISLDLIPSEVADNHTSCIKSISWEKKENGSLSSITIDFNPGWNVLGIIEKRIKEIEEIIEGKATASKEDIYAYVIYERNLKLKNRFNNSRIVSYFQTGEMGVYEDSAYNPDLLKRLKIKHLFLRDLTDVDFAEIVDSLPDLETLVINKVTFCQNLKAVEKLDKLSRFFITNTFFQNQRKYFAESNDFDLSKLKSLKAFSLIDCKITKPILGVKETKARLKSFEIIEKNDAGAFIMSEPS